MEHLQGGRHVITFAPDMPFCDGKQSGDRDDICVLLAVVFFSRQIRNKMETRGTEYTPN